MLKKVITFKTKFNFSKKSGKLSQNEMYSALMDLSDFITY